ncbi:MAG: aminoglycoside phosphotransferase family protein [Desulfobulbaceae bacterium]|uniref:Aminoglycoside phosphotransferase family protein n=1 Tax=Candidatus Desulfobia pelagia TaxID=2841692 RepID=A0A8J6NE12_9BACT|nr:aminoglycoside phosphotransferase family protein [Candidatus Desulfobia pelagia]
MKNVKNAAEHFVSLEEVSSIVQLGSGNVHDTFLVTCRSGYKLILQRMNRDVFPDISRVMENLFFLSEYYSQIPAPHLTGEEPCWQFPSVVLTKNGQSFLDLQDGCWRALRYIDDTRILEKIDNLQVAQEVGHVLAGFHKMGQGVEASRLHDTLPGFHVTPLYLHHYETVINAGVDTSLQGAGFAFCRDFIEKRKSIVTVLEEAKELGKLAVQVIHGDPKLENILFDAGSDKAVALIDLDTVKPGLILYDLGDCLRSCCNRSGGEECDDPGCVSFDLSICRAVLEGYLAEGAGILSLFDYEYLYEAIRLIPFELGMRFFTDYLEGNVYFKVGNEEQNLKRALVQFHLVASIEEQEGDLRELVEELSSWGAR